MSENFENKIKRLELENFTCFAKADMDFSSGINVFIGENGTGKTHVLKALYGTIYDSDNTNYFIPPNNAFLNSMDGTITDKQRKLSEKIISYLVSYFKPENNLLKRLIRRNDVSSSLGLKVFFKGEFLGLNVRNANDNELKKHSFKDAEITNYSLSKNFDTNTNSLFIPSNEMLTLYRGFISSYERRENSFDGTHYHLAKALDALPLRGQALSDIKPLLDDLYKEVGVKVSNQNGQFFIRFDKENIEIEAPLAAEGIKKLAQMIYLIQNGSLNKDTILFWDEPEVNLNPRYIKVVVKFLQTLAKNGVQIFVATHDYLLAHLLSLDASYRRETEAPAMKFFAFYKGEDGTEIESADTIAGIQNNAILDEYSAYYDLEQELYYQSREQTV